MPSKERYCWPDSIRVIGWTGLGVNIYNAWVPKICKDTGMRPRIANTKDSLERFKYTKLGLFDMTAGGTTETSLMMEGDRRFADRDTGPFQIRVVWVQSRGNSGIVVRGDSHIKNIYDIKPGVRVVDMRHYVASQRIQEACLAWAGIKDLEKDVQWVPAYSSEEKVQLIVDGKADMTHIVSSTVAVMRAEKNPYGLRWIDLNEEKDPEGAARFRAIDPLVSFGPMFNGPPSCIGVWGTIGTSLYITNEKTDAEYVYHLAKWMDENWPRYKDGHPWCKYMTRDNLMDELNHTFYPCHEGLIKYLKELGLWTADHDRRQKFNVGMVTRYCEANAAAIARADEMNLWVNHQNPKWIEFWENYKKEINLPKFRMFRNIKTDEFAAGRR
jgi:hypothetical protein